MDRGIRRVREILEGSRSDWDQSAGNLPWFLFIQCILRNLVRQAKPDFSIGMKRYQHDK